MAADRPLPMTVNLFVDDPRGQRLELFSKSSASLESFLQIPVYEQHGYNLKSPRLVQ
jgi:hypothetical protein